MKPGRLLILQRFPPDYQSERLQHLYNRLTEQELQLTLTGLAEVIGQIPGNQTPAEKATILYRSLTEHLSYDHTARKSLADSRQEQSYTYLGALFNGTAVCSGIAQLYAILCRSCGIHCQVVEGFAGPNGQEGLHAWVQIRLPDSHGDPVSYHCDPTWDLTRGKDRRDFRYFLKSDDYFESHYHQWYRDIGADLGWHKFDHCPADAQIPTVDPTTVAKVVAQLRKIRMEHPFVLNTQ